MTQNPHSENRLYLALELSNQEWKLCRRAFEVSLFVR